ncbi:MAG: glycosyltransferase family 4 protein [Longilinea sp.]|nr:glycosyltransferase family 4 protein [Longilinea sp.]MCA1954337.1 glycosyltransferase family 4 protein [Anaerolinea sp.]
MIPIRLGLQQRVLPVYRTPFFQALAADCPQGLGIFAGQPRPHEMVENQFEIPGAQVTIAKNRHFFKEPWYLCWQSGLLHWLETWQPQVLILEANPRYLLSPFAVRWMHARHRPVIGWGLGAPPTNRLRSTWRARFLHQFDAMITYSQQGADQYHAAGLSADRIFVARNAVAARPTEPAPQRPPEFANARPTIIFVGRLQARKLVDQLIQACAAQPTPPQLWIVGDGPERATLEAQAAQILPDAVFWGTRHGEELIRLLDQADLFVLPGTGGLAIQQAMSRALPVIVAAGDGTQSDLVRPENGWNVPPNDRTALQAAIAEATREASRLRRMGLASYRIVREEINLETMVAAFASAVQSVL